MTVISITIATYLAFLLYNSKQLEYLEKLSLSLILGGAVGNLIDRIWLGYVVDFIDIRIFPVFNLADIFINIGVICFIIDIFNSKNETVSHS